MAPEDLFETALRLSTKPLRDSSRAVYRSMWAGYVRRLAGMGRAPGEETGEAAVAAISGAGGELVQQRLYALVGWVYETLAEAGQPYQPLATQLANIYAQQFRRPARPAGDAALLAALVTAAGGLQGGWKGVRLQAVVQVLAETGLRRQELLELRCNDYRPVLHALSAGQKSHQRFLPLSAAAESRLQDWLAVHPAPASPWLFVRDGGGRPMDPTTLWRQLKRVVAATPAGPALGEKAGAQGAGFFRASVAQAKLAQGEDPETVAAFLGHRQLGSTAEWLKRLVATD